jgi:hypothetical protein
MKNEIPKFDIDFKKEYPTLKQNVNGVDIDLTDEEYETTISQWEINQVKAKAEYEAEILKAAQRTALLDRLGITAEEAQLLLGGN